MILWDLGSARPIKRMHGHSDTVNSVAFSKDGNILITGGADMTVRLWSTKDSEEAEIGHIDSGSDPNELGTYPTKRTPILHVTFSRRNLALALGSYSS